jgi:hypothetical protein
MIKDYEYILYIFIYWTYFFLTFERMKINSFLGIFLVFENENFGVFIIKNWTIIAVLYAIKFYKYKNLADTVLF